MKNCKTSHSLSKLQLKRTEYGSNSQRSLTKKHSKRNNQSHIERIGTENLVQKEHHDAVRKQYYGTHQQGIQMCENDSMISKESKMGKVAFQIQQKMKRVLENGFDSEIDVRNVVVEEDDVDEDFEEKILQNKHLLKEQRQKKGSTLSQYKPQEEQLLKKQGRKWKKLSLMQSKNEKMAQRLKSKSLLPAINTVTSKVSQPYPQKSVQNQLKNQTQRRNLKLQNICLLPNIKHKNNQQQKPSNNQINSLAVNNVQLYNQRRLAELHKNIVNKKSHEIKLQSKIQQLKNKIAQRTIAKQNIREKEENNKKLLIQPKVKRYSSHSLFDNIQQFLSNPHQNNGKSQRKFLKLYQKIDDNDDIIQKQKKLLKRKIQLMENRIKYIEQSPDRCVLNQTNDSKDNAKEDIVDRPIETGSHPIEEIDQNATPIWRRMQGSKIQKSNFQNQIKYVNSLEQKGRENLNKYVENQKILHELKMIKRNHDMLNKNQRRLKSQAHFQRPL